MKLFRRIVLIVLVLLAGAVGYFAWTVTVKDLPGDTLVSSAALEVYPTLYGYALEPADAAGKPGLIFIAGAFVPPTAYLPFARKVAEAGYPVRVVRLELGTSMAPGQQERLFGTLHGFLDGSRRWVLGGHSLGSAQATIFAQAFPDEIAGLFITGSGNPYNDVSMLTVPVTLMRASNDNVANRNDDSGRAGNLPADAVVTTIEGGNHAQFGYYGPQIMDGTATISREDQQAQMVAAALALMARVEGSTLTQALILHSPAPAAALATRYSQTDRLGASTPLALRQES